MGPSQGVKRGLQQFQTDLTEPDSVSGKHSIHTTKTIPITTSHPTFSSVPEQITFIIGCCSVIHGLQHGVQHGLHHDELHGQHDAPAAVSLAASSRPATGTDESMILVSVLDTELSPFWGIDAQICFGIQDLVLRNS